MAKGTHATTLKAQGRYKESPHRKWRKLVMQREGLVREYLDKLLPVNWDDIELSERRSFIRGDGFSESVEGKTRRETVCTLEIWCELFGKGANHHDKPTPESLRALFRSVINMPSKPKRPCSKPGCPNLTTGRFCEEHKYIEREREARRHKHYDKHRRNQQAKKFYQSRAWQAARIRALVRDNYLCQECLVFGRITLADTVHHVVELNEDWSKRLDLNNLISLCHSCHSCIHAQ